MNICCFSLKVLQMFVPLANEQFSILDLTAKTEEGKRVGEQCTGSYVCGYQNAHLN